MQVTNKQQRKQTWLRHIKAGAVAVIGCLGFNVTKRVLAELQKFDPRWMIGYDTVDRPEHTLPFQWIRVKTMPSSLGD